MNEEVSIHACARNVSSFEIDVCGGGMSNGGVDCRAGNSACQKMKTLNSKTLIGLMLLALIIGSNGCMTQSAIQYAKGQPGQAWINNTYGYAYIPLSPEYPPVPEPKSQPAYYCLLPLSVPADVVTSPLQLIVIAYEVVDSGGFAHEIPN